MAGRVGTEVFLNRKDTGTRSDFYQAHNLARSMVVDLGLTKAGHLSSGRNPMAPGSQAAPLPFGPDLLNEIDVISRGIVEDSKVKAEAIVLKYRLFIEEAIKPVLMHDETILRPQWLELWATRTDFVQDETTTAA
jgi:ATP-dependent Zn protease